MTSKAPPTMNPWEVQALNYEFPEQSSIDQDGSIISTGNTWRRVPDPIIYPGLYAPSGYDIMAILLRIVSRPNPKVNLGAVDCSVSLVLCDLLQPDVPILHVTDSFCQLTGYSPHEVIGRNCRFLQSPPGKDRRSVSKSDKSAIRHMRHAIRDGEEIQLAVTNYRKNGQPFTNMLTIIPVPWDASGARYSVGFQSEIE
ncbi:PAS domain-containing protein [Mariannaea sp. PMI_226]|nr:PAS domain-containing protein [Mariannaea sp. PMI_226]